MSVCRLQSNHRPAPKDKTRHQEKPVDPRWTLQHAFELPQWSEDRRDTPRACVRAQGPCRSRPHRIDAPKDESAKEANTSRPHGPAAKHSDRQKNPKVSSTSRLLALRSRELINADLSLRLAAPKSNRAALELSFRVPARTFRRSVARPSGSEEPSGSARLHIALPWAAARTSRSRDSTPKGQEASPRRPRGRPWRRCAEHAGRVKTPKSSSAGRRPVWAPPCELLREHLTIRKDPKVQAAA